MKVIRTSNEQPELESLRRLSARLGGDLLLVQASSGNTSVKIDGLMWIKASGKWLIQADAGDFIIPVRLERARKCLKEQTAIPETIIDSSGHSCASIETAMHAVLPHKVVVHVHSVNAIAWAIRKDAPEQLQDRLSGMHWQWIPYIRSGAALASCIGDAQKRFPSANVFVLGNHGLVVCGESCGAVEQLLDEVETLLRLEPRPTSEPCSALLGKLVAGSSWAVPDSPVVHALATDPVSRRILGGGVLYPCQAIFLPATVPALNRSPLKDLPCFQQHKTPFLIEEYGVLCSKDMTRAEREMLAGLSYVVQRIDPSAPLRYLSPAEVIEISNGDTEHYRTVADTGFVSESLTAAGL